MVERSWSHGGYSDSTMHPSTRIEGAIVWQTIDGATYSGLLALSPPGEEKGRKYDEIAFSKKKKQWS